MKRTVRLATVPLNVRKRAELCSVIASYAGVKRSFVEALRPSSRSGLPQIVGMQIARNGP